MTADKIDVYEFNNLLEEAVTQYRRRTEMVEDAKARRDASDPEGFEFARYSDHIQYYVRKSRVSLDMVRIIVTAINFAHGRMTAGDLRQQYTRAEKEAQVLLKSYLPTELEPA